MFQSTGSIRKVILVGWVLCTATSAVASRAAWVFAHRANSLGAVNAAAGDSGINAIEIDVTHRNDVPAHKRCAQVWCAYHDRDRQSENLLTILNTAKGKANIGAVWLDIKSTDKSLADYANLRQTVITALGTGRGTVRKFWGVWPASKLNAPYVTSLQQNFNQLGGNDENLFIIEADSNGDTDTANTQCKKWGLQCGLSVGNPFIGSLGTSSGPSWDMQNFNYISGDIKHMSNINSVFMWNFNWDGPYEDDMMRLIFGHRSYWEYLAGVEWQCGQEGNGVIVGAIDSIYYAGFCDNSNNDACSTASSTIATGPNSPGNRNSNIGVPRNSYRSSSKYDCDKYY